MPESQERRLYSREPYGKWVTLSQVNSKRLCQAQDLSLGGLSIRSSTPLSIGSQVMVQIPMKNRDPVMVRGVVVRRTDGEDGFGVKFGLLSDSAIDRLIDCMVQLKNDHWLEW